MSCEISLGQSANMYSVTNLTKTTLEEDSLMDIWRGLGEWAPWGSGEYQDIGILSGNSLADQHVWMWLKTLPLPVECYQSVRALAVNY